MARELLHLYRYGLGSPSNESPATSSSFPTIQTTPSTSFFITTLFIVFIIVLDVVCCQTVWC